MFSDRNGWVEKKGGNGEGGNQRLWWVVSSEIVEKEVRVANIEC